MEIKYQRTHNGFCRCYYKVNKSTLVCLQLEDSNGNYEQYECSRDGEPSHRIAFDLKDFPLPTGNTSTDTEVRGFLNIFKAGLKPLT